MYARNRLAIAVGACALLVATAASAGPPDATTSTIPSSILVVGTNPGGPDAAGTFTLTIRDFSSNPVPNCVVDVDFSACCDLRICTVVVAGQTLAQCQPPVVTAQTDLSGRVSFTVVGGGLDAGVCVPIAGLSQIAPGAAAGCVAITAGGVPMGTSTAVILDVNGAIGAAFNGHNGGDMAVLVQDVGAQAPTVGGASYRGRCDYSSVVSPVFAVPATVDGKVNGLDISYYLLYLGRSASGIGSGLGCPGNAYCIGDPCPSGGPFNCKSP